MKAKILALIIGLGMGLVFCSCEKDLEKYSGTDYIRFVSVFEKDSVDYNFGLAGKDNDRSYWHRSESDRRSVGL